MHSEDGFTALQVGQLHDDAPIETPRPKQRLIQTLRPVGGRENDNTLCGIEAIHLCEQLIEGLLALVVAYGTVAALSYGINLIDKDDARCLLRRLTEQVAHLGSTHTHEHLHKFRARNREEGHVSFACHGTRYKGFAGSGRAYEQGALRQTGSESSVFLRVMKEVYQLFECSFGLVLACHIGKASLDVALCIYFCARLTQLQESSGRAFHHLLSAHSPYPIEYQTGQNPPDEEINDRRILLREFLGNDYPTRL